MKIKDMLAENLVRTGNSSSAVVGWGRGMGHKGHMLLAHAVIYTAKKTSSDPYFVVSRTVGKDDPIYPEEKLAIYRKVFPNFKNIFQSASDEMSDLNKVLAKLAEMGYRDAIVVVGADQVKAFQFLVRPDKSGQVVYKKLGLDNLKVISRQETGDPKAQEEGPRATPMREILKNPNASDEEKFNVWRDAMSPELSDDEVKDLMAKASERMGVAKTENNLKELRDETMSEQKKIAEAKSELWYDLSAEHVPSKALPLIKQEMKNAGIKLQSIKPHPVESDAYVFSVIANKRALKAARDIIWNYNDGLHVGIMNEGLKNPKDNPCWKGYEPVGTKKKDGKTVPNCVPKKGVAEGLEQAIPEFLYHATYRPLLKSIKTHGLGGSGAQAKWEDSKPGVVYLAIDPNVAESYAETSDLVPDEWLDKIIILKISTRGLDTSKFYLDSNVLDNEGDTLEYHGVIPISNISMYKQGVAEGQLDESNTINFIRGLISEFNEQMSGSPYYPMDYKNPGMRMWTRGDGSRYKDPGYIFIARDLKPEDQSKWHKAKAVEKFWKFLESKGARKIGDVSGEFGSDPHSPAVVLNKLIFVFNGRSIAWGSTSRLKNSNVWRQKQQGVAETSAWKKRGMEDPREYPSRGEKAARRGEGDILALNPAEKSARKTAAAYGHKNPTDTEKRNLKDKIKTRLSTRSHSPKPNLPEEGETEGVMNTIANRVMGRAPANKYQVGQTVRYEMNPPQEGGRGVGTITKVAKDGVHYLVNGKLVNHFEIKGVEQGVAEAAKWRRDDLEGNTWRSADWDDGDLSLGKIQIRHGKDVDDSGDELKSRPGMWRSKGDMAKRMTKKGVPTKAELGFQSNLKNRIKMQQKKGGLTGPQGYLPEQQVNEDEYDRYENGEMSQEDAVAAMFARMAKQGRDPLDMISYRFGWSTYELDDLAQMHGFRNSAEWLRSFNKGMKEGIADTLKRGVKQVKRGLQGWSKGIEDSPMDLVKRNKAYDDETVKSLHKALSGNGPGFPFNHGPIDSKGHSPANLQKRVLDRELKKMDQGMRAGELNHLVKTFAEKNKTLLQAIQQDASDELLGLYHKRRDAVLGRHANLSQDFDELLSQYLDGQANLEEDMGSDASSLNIGDPVIITGNVQLQGKTGDIVGFGTGKSFVVVDLYNYGKHSFHSSDVSYNDYADEEYEDDLYESIQNRLSEDWQKVNKSDKTDGMSKKAVKAYRRENPGSKLQTAVTKKPSEIKSGSKDDKRRKSFCARMTGMKKANASAETKRDPDSPINKALRRWNCNESFDMQSDWSKKAKESDLEIRYKGDNLYECVNIEGVSVGEWNVTKGQGWINTSIMETTTAGSVAPVASAPSKMVRRGSIFSGIKTSKKFFEGTSGKIVKLVIGLSRRGKTDEEIAEELGLDLEEVLRILDSSIDDIDSEVVSDKAFSKMNYSDSLEEGELSEEQLLKKEKPSSKLPQKSPDKELTKKPDDKEVQKKEEEEDAE